MNLKERLEAILEDCVRDAVLLEGLPVHGSTLGRILGEHLAIMGELAASVLELFDQVRAIEQREGLDAERVRALEEREQM